MIWVTRGFQAPKMAAILSWQQESRDNVVRSSDFSIADQTKISTVTPILGQK
jgi:hypothetical protein